MRAHGGVLVGVLYNEALSQVYEVVAAGPLVMLGSGLSNDSDGTRQSAGQLLRRRCIYRGDMLCSLSLDASRSCAEF